MFAILGGFLSIQTTAAGEMPKWNGWSYFFFSVKEIAMVGAMLALPLSLIILVVTYFNSSDGTK